MDGSVLAWGSGMPGGNGTPLAGSAARVVAGLAGIAAVRTTISFEPEHSLAVGADGSVYGWGNNGDYGALAQPRGNGSVIVETPVALPALGRAVHVEGCGGFASLALHADGTVWVLPSTAPFSGDTVPVTARALSGLADIAFIGRGLQGNGASGSTCQLMAVNRQGAAFAVDLSVSSSNGYTVNHTVQAVGNLPPVSQVSCSHHPNFRHCLALATDGRVWGWGNNVYGELADGTTTSRTIPVLAQGVAGIVQVAVADNTSFAIDAGGQLYSWGFWTGRGNLRQTDAAVPVAMPGFERTSAVAGGLQSACALRLDGTVWCWGVNQAGQLGAGTITDVEDYPVQAVGIQLN